MNEKKIYILVWVSQHNGIVDNDCLVIDNEDNVHQTIEKYYEQARANFSNEDKDCVFTIDYLVTQDDFKDFFCVMDEDENFEKGIIKCETIKL